MCYVQEVPVEYIRVSPSRLHFYIGGKKFYVEVAEDEQFKMDGLHSCIIMLHVSK